MRTGAFVALAGERGHAFGFDEVGDEAREVEVGAAGVEAGHALEIGVGPSALGEITHGEERGLGGRGVRKAF